VTARASCVLAFAAAAMACGPPPAPEGDVAPLIHAAVLRYEAKQFMSGERLPICIRIHGHAGEIVAGVRDALNQTLPDIRSAEACAIVEGDVYLAGSRVPAVLLTSGPIRWIADDEVQVAGGFARTKSSTSRPTYRVVRDGGRWVCLGPVVTGVPL
jgi:hypothetical protein